MNPGVFITFEGGEGAGKSTQVRRLAETIARNGVEVVTTREPGGSPLAERIRTLILDPEAAEMDAVTQTLLFAAARAEHVRATIRPALARGAVVLCDRFTDSTRAYQGAGGGVAAGDVAALERIAVGRAIPDLTLILDLPVEVGMARARARFGGSLAGSDRFERKDVTFHERIREAFRELAEREPQRCVLIDADADAGTVATRIAEKVIPRLPARFS